jgi:hypothetical protein
VQLARSIQACLIWQVEPSPPPCLFFAVALLLVLAIAFTFGR